jgi:HEAT repeat protein
MARVFISYVGEDLPLVRRLVDILREYDIEVWFDRDALKPGVRWRDEIRAGITLGDYFIACFSHEYSKRVRSFMNEELTLAIEELRQRPFDRAWFLPVLLSETEIPDRSIGAGETLRSIQWVDLFHDWHAGVAKILSVVQPNSAKVHELIKTLGSKSARERIRAADTLRKLGPLGSQAVPHLLPLLGDRNETVRASAAQALGMIGVASEEVASNLSSILAKAELYYDTEHAIRALANLGRPGVQALLEAGASARGYAVGHKALEAVTAMGNQVIPDLVELIESGNGQVEAAEYALSKIHDVAGLQNLAAAVLSSKALGARIAAAIALGEVFRWNSDVTGSEVEMAVSSLIGACREPEIRSVAVQSLGSAGVRAVEAVPAMIVALRDHVPEAATALGRVGVSFRTRELLH